jgi:hypothetical protein
MEHFEENEQKNNIRKARIMIGTGVLLLVGTFLLSAIGLTYTVRVARDMRNVREEAQTQRIEAERQYKVAETRARLFAVWALLKANGDTNQAKQEIAATREEFKKAYDNAEADSQTFWSNVDQQLATIEKEASENRTKAIKSIETILENLRQEMQAQEGA